MLVIKSLMASTLRKCHGLDVELLIPQNSSALASFMRLSE